MQPNLGLKLDINMVYLLFVYKYCLLITLANSLDPDQAYFVGPDLDPNCLTLCWSYCKKFLKELILKKKSADDKKIMKKSQRANS